MHSMSIFSCNSIKTLDFCILYATIPHSKLKNRIKELVQLHFIKKNVQCSYKYLVLGQNRIKTLTLPDFSEIKWYHQYARFCYWQHVWKTLDIPMGTN